LINNPGFTEFIENESHHNICVPKPKTSANTSNNRQELVVDTNNINGSHYHNSNMLGLTKVQSMLDQHKDQGNISFLL